MTKQDAIVLFTLGLLVGGLIMVLVVIAFPLSSPVDTAPAIACRETDRVESVIDDARLVTITITCNSVE